MKKFEKISKDSLLKIEEIHTLPLMLLAMVPVLMVLVDLLSGIFLGLATVLVFLLLEGSMYLIGRDLSSRWRSGAYLVMLVALAIASGVFLQPILYERTETSLLLVIAEQIASVYLVNKLLKNRKKKENPEQKQGIRTFLRMLLFCFEAAMEYMIFLVVLGVLRELLGKWLGATQLLGGGFVLTAGLLFLWKATGTMPERFWKMPRFALSVGFVLFVVLGFVCLI